MIDRMLFRISSGGLDKDRHIFAWCHDDKSLGKYTTQQSRYGELDSSKITPGDGSALRDVGGYGFRDEEED